MTRIEVLQEFASFAPHHDEEWQWRAWHEHRAVEGQAERNRAYYLRLRADPARYAVHLQLARDWRAAQKARRK